MSSNSLVALAIGSVLALSAAGPTSAQAQVPPESVTAEQAIACIKTALAARQGRLKDLEIEVKSGKTMCEVEIVDTNGRKVEVHVDVAANTVTRVED
jgi:uncharacterized membrane protein YkoI